MSRLPRISDLAEGSAGWSYYLCAKKEVRAGRGGAHLWLLLQDVSGQIPARVLQGVETLRDEFDAGEFVKIQGRTDRQHQQLELIVDSIRRVHPEQDARNGFREEDCVPSAPRPIGEMWADLQSRLAAVRNPWIRQLLTTLVERYSDRLRIWPAAVVVHHAYRGGLLEHVLAIADAGAAVARVYGIDPDLVVAGAIVHDIGKLEELEYDTVARYSTRGNLVGHIALGVAMVRETASRIDGFPDDLRTRLEHLVLSHHGAKELGSPVEPMTEEAIVLSALDDLDATLHQVRRHVRDDTTEGAFTSYNPRLKRVLFKPSGR
jgi:3'-5' exoribonuclease